MRVIGRFSDIFNPEPWPAWLRWEPTPEQLLDDGRADGIIAIYAPIFEDARRRRLVEIAAKNPRWFGEISLPTSVKSPNAKPVFCITNSTKYPSVSIAALAVGCDPGLICRAIKQRKPYRDLVFIYA